MRSLGPSEFERLRSVVGLRKTKVVQQARNIQRLRIRSQPDMLSDQRRKGPRPHAVTPEVLRVRFASQLFRGPSQRGVRRAQGIDRDPGRAAESHPLTPQPHSRTHLERGKATDQARKGARRQFLKHRR